MSDSYRWRFTDAAGAEMEHVGLGDMVFPDQGEAEAWLSEQWPLLADAGVSAVTLLREEEVVYGPMSLSP